MLKKKTKNLLSKGMGWAAKNFTRYSAGIADI